MRKHLAFTSVVGIAGLAFVFGVWVGRFRSLAAVEKHVERSPGSDACAHTRDSFRCVRYVSNYDGDTIRVDIPGVHPLVGSEISIRVRGIDSPEMKGHQPCEKTKALEAKRAVASLLGSAHRIDLEDIARDKYFRILATVRADGQSVSTLLLSKSLAYRYDGKTKPRVNWCRGVINR